MNDILVAIHSRFAAWNIPSSCVDRLRAEFPRHRFLHATSTAGGLELVASADIAFTSDIGPEQFQAASRLVWVHSPAAGVGTMLFPAMRDSNVVLTNSRGVSAVTIAEHVIAVTLAIFRKMPLAFRCQRERRWVQDEMVDPPAIRTIDGTRAVIVGLGAIGRAVAIRMSALGAHVTGIRRRTGEALPPGVSAAASPDDLGNQLADAHVVVIAAPLTPQTRGMIGRAELAAMRADALLVNVSRGKLVDERALVEALRAGRPGAAALDVFEHEPLASDSPMWSMPNVLITPHTSGFRPDHWDAVTTLFIEQLHRYERGEPLLNVVDKQAGY